MWDRVRPWNVVIADMNGYWWCLLMRRISWSRWARRARGKGSIGSSIIISCWWDMWQRSRRDESWPLHGRVLIRVGMTNWRCPCGYLWRWRHCVEGQFEVYVAGNDSFVLDREPYIEFTLIDDFVQEQRPFTNEFVLLSLIKDRYAHVERSLEYVQSNLLVPFRLDRGDE